MLRDVFNGIPTLPGRTIFSVTSSTPRQTRETTEMVSKVLGASAYLHGWIMSLPSEAQNQQATISYGGPQSGFAKHKSACKTLGTALWISEDPQQVALIDNGAMSMVAGLFAEFVQSLALVGKGDIDRVLFTREVLLPQLDISIGWLLRPT